VAITAAGIAAAAIAGSTSVRAADLGYRPLHHHRHVRVLEPVVVPPGYAYGGYGNGVGPGYPPAYPPGPGYGPGYVPGYGYLYEVPALGLVLPNAILPGY